MSLEYHDNLEYQNQSRKSISRYNILRVISDKDIYLETYNKVSIPESENDSYHIVLPNEANRLDIISNKYYRVPYYWWAIALANNLIDPFIVNEGVMLRIPSLLTLADYHNKILTR